MTERRPSDPTPPEPLDIGSAAPLCDPLVMASVYRVRDLDHLDRIHSGAEPGYLYAREGHPNARQLAASLATREGAEAGLVVSSGMAAAAVVFLDRVRAGDIVVAGNELYGRTQSLLADRLARLGVETRFVDPRDARAVAEAFRGAKLGWVESMSNPLLKVAPLDVWRAAAKQAGALLAVDATFTPAPVLDVLSLGADLVVHSLTKILSGHSAVTLGFVGGRKELIDSLDQTAATYGWHAAPMDCWLAEQGLATFALRLERASANARALGRALPSMPGVVNVVEPGAVSHPDHAWLAAHGRGFGFMIGLELAGGRDAVNRLFQRLKVAPFCPSLGDLRTTVSYPAATSHRWMNPSDREKLGIGPGLVRVSLGIEDSRVLVEDFSQALS